MAIMGFTRVMWPKHVADLLFGLSAFLLNVEIVAPECSELGLHEAGMLNRDPAVLYEEKYAVAISE
jgi:hypothetical protein